jgi:hypothetical protein
VLQQRFCRDAAVTWTREIRHVLLVQQRSVAIVCDSVRQYSCSSCVLNHRQTYILDRHRLLFHRRALVEFLCGADWGDA